MKIMKDLPHLLLLCLLLFSQDGKASNVQRGKTSNFGSSFEPSNLDNMNGEYPLSKTPGADSNFRDKIPKQFKDYPGGVESFDVYSPPMTTLYSQVWWAPLAPADLPEGIVQKYAGKGMAIVGWEIDQVRQTPDGVERSVPISASYNHHYVARMIGADASFRKVKLNGPNDPLATKIAKQQSGCGGHVSFDQEQYLIEGPEFSSRGHKTNVQCSSGNGGEYRKTFHGFPPGHALVIDSPTQIQISPMQIDTWNREEMDIDGPFPPKFVPGPLPRASLAPAEGARHSGLLECPMTTRLTKVVDSANYTFWDQSTTMCEEPIITSYECFEAAAKLLNSGDTTGTTIHNETGKDPNLPKGCSVISNIYGIQRVFFNEMIASSTPCSTEKRCVCPEDNAAFGSAKGALLYHPTNQSADTGSGMAAYFDNKCGRNHNLLEMENPTCDIRYYRGGQWACKHMWSLLDADQEIPWADQPLVFHHKYRFWVQPFQESYHQKLTLGEAAGSALLIGSPWEYDIPKCDAGIPGCTLADDGKTWIHTVEGNMMGRHTFVTLNNHCHAPACLSTSVYACPKETALHDCNSTSGKLVCETIPIYGGTGHPSMAGTRFDEPGYIAVPDCLWGSEEFGLEAPVNLDGIPLYVVKKSNATDGHYGEMSGKLCFDCVKVCVDFLHVQPRTHA